MNLNLANGTTRQQSWFNAAYAALAAAFPLDRVDVDVTVVWVAEPPCPGHSEFACTTFESPTAATIHIRRTLDAVPDTDAYGGQQFYMETCAHELGHVVIGAKVTNTAAVAAMFERIDSPAGAEPQTGGAGDWSAGATPGAAAWPASINEAAAETFKDLFLPPDMRRYDNRTYWWLQQSRLEAFCQAIGMNFATGTPSTTVALPLHRGPDYSRAALFDTYIQVDQELLPHINDWIGNSRWLLSASDLRRLGWTEVTPGTWRDPSDSYTVEADNLADVPAVFCWTMRSNLKGDGGTTQGSLGGYSGIKNDIAADQVIIDADLTMHPDFTGGGGSDT